MILLMCRLVFNLSIDDVNARSREDAIQSGIPSAIFLQAEQAPGGLQSSFRDPNKFVRYTEQIYVCVIYRLLDDIALDTGL